MSCRILLACAHVTQAQRRSLTSASASSSTSSHASADSAVSLPTATPPRTPPLSHPFRRPSLPLRHASTSVGTHALSGACPLMGLYLRARRRSIGRRVSLLAASQTPTPRAFLGRHPFSPPAVLHVRARRRSAAVQAAFGRGQAPTLFRT
ncbi:hypothetical protein GGX14DRAFT_563663 [Mycena pura]|uniref:Uncharacterized protein n=1 Tax=Mycena pura TaxID=153505 RepID=A0AAD6VIP4_9AGAR|nr:hypothetical protein GGX14DRAFT_563663 [Mycena pura]